MDSETILSGLNPQQRQAAEAIDGAFLVVAGAGSGKTTVLSRRVAALISLGIDPTSILLLTFTRVAAKNMIERSKKLSPAAIDIAGGTFHSIAHQLVLQNHTMFRLPERPTLLDPDDIKSAFRKIAAANGGKEDNMPKAGAIAKVHSFAVNTKQPIDEVVWQKMPQFSYAIDFVQKCAAEYKSYKRSRGVLDYDDLLVGWDTMMDHPAIGDAIRRRFRYVLIDEYQDSNAIQCSIVSKLGGDNPNVMAVGDPAQSIYGFRGSAPRTMFAFREVWPNSTVIKLDINYRSGEDILAVANAVDQSMFERFDRKLLVDVNSHGNMPRFVTVAGLDQEATFIADEVLAHKENGTDLKDQAVLVRSMMAARHVEAEFVRRRIPYKVSGGIRINEAAHIKDLLCLTRTVVNAMDEPAWMRVLTMARGIGDKKAETVYSKIVALKSDNPFADPTPIIADMCKKSPDTTTIVEAYRALAAGGPPVEALDRAVALLDNIFVHRYEDWKARKGDLPAVSGLAEKHDTLDSFLSMVTLDYSIDKKSEVSGYQEEEQPITISTVHSAKGLEWDIVYIPSFMDGHLPSIYSREPDDIEEEKRVLYVAVTRPRQSLIMVRPVMGRMNAIAAESPFEHIISDFTERERRGHIPRPRSFSLDVDVDIDIFG